MFRILAGDKKLIDDTIQQISKDVKMEVKFSKNIFEDLKKQYGLFYTPRLLYFLYDEKDMNVEALKNIPDRLNVVCVIETEIDKRGAFYKTFKDDIEFLGAKEVKETIDMKVARFKKDVLTALEVSPNESISFLYRLFYDFRYKALAGRNINRVLTGKVKTNDIMKLFVLEVLDKYEN